MGDMTLGRPARSAKDASPAPPDLSDYPVREYVASMARELARMARWDGDEPLARALEVAAELASRPASAV